MRIFLIIFGFSVLSLGFYFWWFKSSTVENDIRMMNDKDEYALLLENPLIHKKQNFQDDLALLIKYEKANLEYGVSKKTLPVMRQLYMRLEKQGRWLNYCGLLSQSFGNNNKFIADTPIKVQPLAEEDPINIMLPLSSWLWQDIDLSFFCLSALHYSGFHERVVFLVSDFMSQKRYNSIKEKLHKLLVMSLYQNNQMSTVINLCQQYWLSLKSEPEALSSCAGALIAENQFDKGIRLYGLAYTLSKDISYLQTIARIYIELGRHEQASQIIKSLPR